MSEKHCMVCGEGSGKQIYTCPDCSILPHRTQYKMIQSHFDESIIRAKELCSEAYKAGDEETVWVCRASIAAMERSKAGLNKPK